jgi:4-hydroxy-tetrahydrodipicolinate reductase
MTRIKIVVAGPRGKMGKEAVLLASKEDTFELVGVIDRKNDGKRLYDLDGPFADLDVPVFTNAEECFQKVKPDCFIDLTTPEAGYLHTKTALLNNIRAVVGTTGFTKEQLNELSEICKEKQVGCIIAPNFALGAVLMMKFAQMAAKYFSDVEIIELHHDQKLDAPSGTALKTAELMNMVRKEKQQGHPNEKETIPGARGGDFSGMKIHSIRLPGLIAHQQVIFGTEGQTLTIRHDSYDRASFMSGVKLSVETVFQLNELVYGLENILD